MFKKLLTISMLLSANIFSEQVWQGIVGHGPIPGGPMGPHYGPMPVMRHEPVHFEGYEPMQPMPGQFPGEPMGPHYRPMPMMGHGPVHFEARRPVQPFQRQQILGEPMQRQIPNEGMGMISQAVQAQGWK